MTLDYLIVACHPDDAELCLGGTILSLQAQGHRVGILDLTSGEPTPHGSEQIRKKETAKASQILNITHRENLGLPNRALVADLESRRLLAERFRQLRPRIILTHYWQDAHPDHVAASELVDAARFWSKLTKVDWAGEPFYPEKIIYFFSFHLRQHVAPSFVVDVSPFHSQKMEAIRAYHSQFVEGRSQQFPTLLDDIAARDRYFGWSIGVPFAEPFCTKELVGLKSLDALC